MRKSAQQKLNEFFDEIESVRAAVTSLQVASNEKYQSSHYASGFLGESLIDAVMMLPKAKREEFRQRLASKAAQMSNKI